MTEINHKQMILELYLPLPPTVNHYWGHSHHGLFLKSASLDFRRNVAKAFKSQRDIYDNFPIKHRVAVTVILHGDSNRSYDLDNRIKPLFDALTHCGVWVDDKQIDYFSAHRGNPMPPHGFCVVTITDVIPTIEDEENEECCQQAINS